MTNRKIRILAGIIGIIATIAGIVCKMYLTALDAEKDHEQRISKYEERVRSIKINDKKNVKVGDSILIANLSHHRIRISIKYETLSGDWLLEGTVPFAPNELDYLDSYTNNSQVYINCQVDSPFFYNNELPTDTVTEKVTEKIPYLFLIGAANPYKNLYPIKLYSATLDKNNILIITDKKLSQIDFRRKADSIYKVKTY